MVDTGARELLRAGKSVPLPPKTFDFLALLVTERPRAVSKQEIRDRVWPETFVTDSSLTSLVSALRGALGDDARNPRLLRTVHGHGYAFCGAARANAARASQASRYRLYCQDREIGLREGENVLGRTEDATVWIDSATVSRRHARLTVAEGRVRLEDLGSRNGTWVDGRRLTTAISLSDGDEFRVGRVPVVLRALRATSSTQSRSRR